MVAEPDLVTAGRTTGFGVGFDTSGRRLDVMGGSVAPAHVVHDRADNHNEERNQGAATAGTR
jgi:hypothetical protein